MYNQLRDSTLGTGRRDFACESAASLDAPGDSALADEITAAAGAHDGGVDGVSGDVTAVARAIGFAFASHDQGHFTREDNVRRLGAVRVVWIAGVGAILPDVDVRKAFAAELRGEFRFVHVGDFNATGTDLLHARRVWGRRRSDAVPL